jgi:hypothetical protein
MPFFEPLVCETCQSIIRGSMFQKTNEGPPMMICEGCYRKQHYGDDNYLKVYKHCALNSINEADSQRICCCSAVSHIDSDGFARKLFPVNEADHHRGSKNNKAIKCGLLNLGTLVAEAKYHGMFSKLEKPTNLIDQERYDKAQEQKRKLEETKRAKARGTALGVVNQTSLVDSRNRVAEAGNSASFEEGGADEDVPFFLRKFANKYPFGNVHMALRIGPLIIENGVEQYVDCQTLET